MSRKYGKKTKNNINQQINKLKSEIGIAQKLLEIFPYKKSIQNTLKIKVEALKILEKKESLIKS